MLTCTYKNILTRVEGKLGDDDPTGGEVEPEPEHFTLSAVQRDGDVARVLQIRVRYVAVRDGLLRLIDLAATAEPHFRLGEYLLEGKLLFLSSSLL